LKNLLIGTLLYYFLLYIFYQTPRLFESIFDLFDKIKIIFCRRSDRGLVSTDSIPKVKSKVRTFFSSFPGLPRPGAYHGQL